MIKKIKKYTKDSAGFSFAELMVVIALIGVLSAIAIPGFLKTLPEKRLKNATRNLYADLQRARLLAVNQNGNIVVSFNTSSGSYSYDVNNVNLSDYGAITYGCSATPTNWNGSAIPPSGVTGNITFTKTGSSSSQSIYLQTQNNQNICYAVTTTSFGAVKIRRFSGSWL